MHARTPDGAFGEVFPFPLRFLNQSPRSNGPLCRWASFNYGNRYPISQGQLKMQTGLDGTVSSGLSHRVLMLTSVPTTRTVLLRSVCGKGLASSLFFFFTLYQLPLVFSKHAELHQLRV